MTYKNCSTIQLFEVLLFRLVDCGRKENESQQEESNRSILIGFYDRQLRTMVVTACVYACPLEAKRSLITNDIKLE